MNNTDFNSLRKTYGEIKHARVQHLDARMPVWLIWTGIVLTVLAVLTEWTTLLGSLEYANGIPYGILQTAGYILLYWACFRGMRRLPHACTLPWWILLISLFLCLISYLDIPNHALALMERSVANVFIFLCYITIGILILVWFEGRLRTFGIMLLLEAMGFIPIPFLSLALFLDERCYYSNLITVPITLGLIWVAGKLLLGKPAASYQ